MASSRSVEAANSGGSDRLHGMNADQHGNPCVGAGRPPPPLRHKGDVRGLGRVAGRFRRENRNLIDRCGPKAGIRCRRRARTHLAGRRAQREHQTACPNAGAHQCVRIERTGCIERPHASDYSVTQTDGKPLVALVSARRVNLRCNWKNDGLLHARLNAVAMNHGPRAQDNEGQYNHSPGRCGRNVAGDARLQFLR